MRNAELVAVTGMAGVLCNRFQGWGRSHTSPQGRPVAPLPHDEPTLGWIIESFQDCEVRGSGVRVLASLLDATGSSPANRWSFPPATLERHTGYSLPTPPGWAEVRATVRLVGKGIPELATRKRTGPSCAWNSPAAKRPATSLRTSTALFASP